MMLGLAGALLLSGALLGCESGQDDQMLLEATQAMESMVGHAAVDRARPERYRLTDGWIVIFHGLHARCGVDDVSVIGACRGPEQPYSPYRDGVVCFDRSGTTMAAAMLSRQFLLPDEAHCGVIQPII
jgi:hypothetical protein